VRNKARLVNLGEISRFDKSTYTRDDQSCHMTESDVGLGSFGFLVQEMPHGIRLFVACHQDPSPTSISNIGWESQAGTGCQGGFHAVTAAPKQEGAHQNPDNSVAA
jgi:hypothetical protein